MQAYSKQLFYGWQTQDDRLWWDVWFLYSENINPFTSTGYVELSRKPTAVQTTNILCTDTIEIQNPDLYSTRWKIFTGSATIFKEWQTAFWGQNFDPSYITNVADRQIKHIWQEWEYVYWTYEWSGANMIIGRFEALDLNNSYWTPTYWYSWFTGTLNAKHTSWVYKMVKVGNIYYLTMWDKISRVDFWTMSITNYDFWGDIIVWINYKNGWFQITLKWGKVYFWDGVSDGPWDIQELPDYIVATVQIWTDTYLIWWEYQWYGLSSPSLYVLWANWFEKLFTQTKSEVMNESKFRIVFNSNQSVTKVRDFIVMIDQANTGKDRIAVYGTNVKWLPRAYVVLNTRNSAGSEMIEIGFVKAFGNKLYFSWYDGTNNWVDYINFDPFALFTYESTGFIVTNYEDMWDKVIRKAQCQLFTRLSNIDSSNTVKIEQYSDDGAFTNMKTVNSLDSTSIDRESNIGEFRDTCFKLTLTGSWDKSPRLYWLKLEYENQGI